MNEQKSKVTTTEAAQLAKCSVRHIQNMIQKKGKLSATRDDSGNYQIDMSELVRVFPHAHPQRIEAKAGDISAHTALEKDNEHLKEMLRIRTEQNDWLHEQLELICAEKKQLMDILGSNLKLLEYQSDKKRKKVLGIF